MSNTTSATSPPFNRTNLNSTTTSYQQQQKSQSQPQSRLHKQTPHYPHTASSISPDRPQLHLSASSPVEQPESAYTRFLSPSPPSRRNPGDFLSLQKTPTLDVSTLDCDAASLFLRSSPKVSPYPYVASYYGRSILPPPRPNSLPPPKYNMPTIDEVETQSHVKDERVEIQHPSATSAPNQHGHGVEMVLKASQTAEQNERSRQEYYMSRQHLQGPANSSMKAPEEEGGNNTSPPRDQRNAKVTIVSPPEGEAPRRGPAGYDASNGKYFEVLLLMNLYPFNVDFHRIENSHIMCTVLTK